MTEDSKTEGPEREPGGHSISIGGNVGPGAAVGPNSAVQAVNIAGRDITTTSEVTDKTPQDFYDILGELRKLIELAREEGELDEGTAKTALKNVEAAAELASQKPPPKKSLLRRLEDISDLLDSAAETIQAAGGAARVIIRAIPVAALLLKLASYLF